MLKIKLSFFSFAFIFICCNTSNRNEKQNSNNKAIEYNTNEIKNERQNDDTQIKDSSFIKTISKINILQLPIVFYCGIESAPWAKDLGADIEKIAPENSLVAGVLPVNNNYIYVIYGFVGDILYPHLYTYNKKGELLDSLYLHINYCVADEYVIISTVTTIKSDFSIEMSDTTKEIHYDDMNNLVIDSIIVKERKLTLNEYDLFTTNYEHKKRIK
ncbi:MAG: hypothetical protein LBT27_08250 [Prevotellaceae bacterium]|jgi:hypothetical protein|nr:hypothetical protein [Prevotellaceae bacterium]